MSITHVLHEARLHEMRAVAFAGDTPVALFHDSEMIARGPRLGTQAEAILRDRPDGLDGGFCETGTGERVFVRFARKAAPPLGTRLVVEIVSEARGGKVARGRVLSDQSAPRSIAPFKAWRDWTGEHVPADAAEGAEQFERIDEAFETALSPSVTLPGGGRLTLSGTPALTAIDIDTAGRGGRAGRARAAREINLQAAVSAAEQLCLRGIGGLGVLDCVAPVPKSAGAEIKAAFLDRFREISPRKAAALAPSPFGLMEISLAWAECPIGAVLGEVDAARKAPVGLALDGLRMLEREAGRAPSVALTLAMPEAACMAAGRLMGGVETLAAGLGRRLGPRIAIKPSPNGRMEVTRQ